MKGLLIKDLYLAAKNCRLSLIIAALFGLVALFAPDSTFFLFYPCMIAGMIPVTLLGYDERSRWIEYSGTLPYTKTQLVSVKYLIGLICQGAMMLLILVGYLIKNSVTGTFSIQEFLSILWILITVSLLATAISLPFIFKLGIEKGRVAYYISLGIVAVLCIFGSSLVSVEVPSGEIPGGILPVACLAALVIYALSWYASVVFYKKREV